MLARNLPRKTNAWGIFKEGLVLLILLAGIYAFGAVLYAFGG
jgi:hypothetical protein